LFLFTSCEVNSDLSVIEDCSTRLKETQINDQLASDRKIMSHKILGLINAHRQSIGLIKLKSSITAKYLASKHNDFQINNGEISHENFQFRTCYLSNFTNVTSTGENVASGFKLCQSVMNRWLNSDRHKKNIEGDFVSIGIAVDSDYNNKLYYSTLFFK